MTFDLDPEKSSSDLRCRLRWSVFKDGELIDSVLYARLADELVGR